MRHVGHLSRIITQGDLGGKVSIFVGESISPCKKEVHMTMCNSEWLPKHSCPRLQIEKHCEWYSRFYFNYNLNVSMTNCFRAS